MDGFLLIDKEADWTSHDVVARVRRLLDQKRVGHTGTLDPDATGLLIVCAGSATRLIEYTSEYPKNYVASLALGTETDTQDASGEILHCVDASHITCDWLNNVIPQFVGEIDQVPPMVSAVRHKGERLYEIARRGESVERPSRRITIHSLEVSEFVPGATAHATLQVECSSGSYVRTLCHDIGQALEVGGHMASLRRTAIGPFSVDEALTLGALEEYKDRLPLDPTLLRPPAQLLPAHWAVRPGSEAEWEAVWRGQAIPASGTGEIAAFVLNGRLGAVLRRDQEWWKPVKVFPER